MATASWLWAASSINPAAHILTWLTTGAIWPLV